ncbi:T9SS type A sorting domain-containing protein [Flavobacterium silvaticum]|uniref:T9SS type A sorting domain-containing protein n=1 Tax=Flavobacterium silvaticum TaxID=1852020 RepID=A0A972FMA4_9FLAO|nr:T9SS type A sorting domain-containing protein [Flavobacterium silvaticum]NMH28674.1 T9SS type A sorting domain-containing protein [Flavobacterium silvaticum]
MKKNYFFLLLAFCAAASSWAQVVANADTPPPANILQYSAIINSDGSYFSVLANDTFNGQPATIQNVSIIDLNTIPGINISPNNGAVYVQTFVLPGTYTVYYQISQGANTSMAAVTITTCNQAAPTLNFAPATCNSPGMATVSDLPAGNWTIIVDPYPFYAANDGAYTFTGSGSTTSVPLDSEGYQYRIRVVSASGCVSPFVQVDIPWMQIIGSDTQAEYLDANSNGIVDLGDMVVCQISLTNFSECDITNVMGGSGIIQFSPIDVIPANSTVVVPGFYMITEQDILDGSANDWEPITGISPLGQVYSKAFFNVTLPIPTGFHFYAYADTNANNQLDSGEPLVPYGSFVYQQNNEEPVTVQAYTGEFTLYDTTPSNVYSVHFEPGITCGSGFTSDTVYSNLSIDPNGIVNLGFPLDPSDCVDLSVWLYGNNAVPGFQSYSYAIVRNESLMVQPVYLTYTADPLVSIANVDGGTGTTITGNTAVVSMLLQPMETEVVYFYYDTPGIPTVDLGQPLHFSASVTVMSNETITDNNEAFLTKIVSGSFDPNSKSETHGPQIVFDGFAADDTLNYTLNFENTGNGNAMNIRLTDELDNKLDETSVRLIGATHNVQMYREGNALEFAFNNIMLPPSEENTQIGKGSVQFTVKLKPGYAIGDIVNNTASIYFDTNPAIVTNTVATEFVTELGVADHDSQSLRIYPNPAKHNLNVAGSNIKSIDIIDITGKVILSKNVGATETEIGISQLSNGVYFAKITTNDTVKTVRFVKQ